jgi:hypothetical protein
MVTDDSSLKTDSKTQIGIGYLEEREARFGGEVIL